MRFKLRSAAVEPSAAPPPPPNMSDRPPPRPECNKTPEIVPIIDTMLITNITYSIKSRTEPRISPTSGVRSVKFGHKRSTAHQLATPNVRCLNFSRQQFSQSARNHPGQDLPRPPMRHQYRAAPSTLQWCQVSPNRHIGFEPTHQHQPQKMPSPPLG